MKKKRDRKNESAPKAGFSSQKGQSKEPPSFGLTAGDTTQAKKEEGSGEKKRSTKNKSVAKLKIHSDTETVNRSKLTLPELMAARVGHSWVSLEYNDPDAIPETVPQPTKALIEAGYGHFGFWPLINRTGENTFPEQAQQRVDMGLTPGSGTSDNVAHRGFSKNPFNSWVPGRVEEPDVSHNPKASKSYDLTQDEVDKVLAYKDSKKNADYSLYKYNCTTFAVEAVKAAGKNAPGGDNFLGVCLPNALYSDLYKMQQSGDTSVETAPLAEGEMHASPSKKQKREESKAAKEARREERKEQRRNRKGPRK